MAIVREQYKVGQGNGASAPVTFTNNVKAGSLLICCASLYDSTGGRTYSIADRRGNTWVELYETLYNAAANDTGYLAYAMNASAGATTVTITPSAGTVYYSVVIIEVSGILTALAKDQNNMADTAGANWDSGNITTTVDDEYIIGMLALDNGDQVLTQDGAWTLIFEEETGSADMPISVSERIVSATLTESYSGTIAASSDYFAAIASFKIAGGSSPSASPSGSPSASPSASPSEGTPSGSPSSSPSEGTPSGSPSEGTPSGSPSEGTPSGSPSEGTPSASPSEGTPSASPSEGTPSASPSEGTPSASPSEGTPSASPSEGTPSGSPSEGTPSASPSEGTPSASPSEGTPSGSPSEGTPSGSPSEGTPSASPSEGTPSASPSEGTPSASPSEGTPSASPSEGTPSASPSEGTPSGSPSASGTPPELCPVCWGHVTGVTETILTFAGNWAGTGAIAGVGDAEVIELNAGEYMISEVVNTGATTVTLEQNHYDPTGDDVDMDYRHGATVAGCYHGAWNDYAGPFASLGYIQIRLTSTL